MSKAFTTDINKHSHRGWDFYSKSSRILKSDGPERTVFEEQLKIPSLPEMVFAENILSLRNSSTNHGIEFNALDALKLVDSENESVHVANSQVWKEARSDCEHINKKVHSYDWTFSTEYAGTLHGDFKIEGTDEVMDMEALKKREAIVFYADLLLYEDELHDCGCSLINVKIRVMPTLLFILQRFYLRVDDVLVRTNETRLLHKFGTDYLLREYVRKQAKSSALADLPPSTIQDANIIGEHLNTIYRKVDKLTMLT